MYDPGTRSVMYLKESKTSYTRGAYATMFTVALFTIAKIRNIYQQMDKESVVYLLHILVAFLFAL